MSVLTIVALHIVRSQVVRLRQGPRAGISRRNRRDRTYIGHWPFLQRFNTFMNPLQLGRFRDGNTVRLARLSEAAILVLLFSLYSYTLLYNFKFSQDCFGPGKGLLTVRAPTTDHTDKALTLVNSPFEISATRYSRFDEPYVHKSAQSSYIVLSLNSIWYRAFGRRWSARRQYRHTRTKTQLLSPSP